jgi:hypothetical protein
MGSRDGPDGVVSIGGRLRAFCGVTERSAVSPVVYLHQLRRGQDIPHNLS